MKAMRIQGFKTNTKLPRLTMNFSDDEVRQIHYSIQNAVLDNPVLEKMIGHFEEFLNTEDSENTPVNDKKIYKTMPAMEQE